MPDHSLREETEDLRSRLDAWADWVLADLGHAVPRPSYQLLLNEVRNLIVDQPAAPPEAPEVAPAEEEPCPPS